MRQCNRSTWQACIVHTQIISLLFDGKAITHVNELVIALIAIGRSIACAHSGTDIHEQNYAILEQRKSEPCRMPDSLHQRLDLLNSERPSGVYDEKTLVSPLYAS